MFNNSLAIKVKEELVRSLVILKLKKKFNSIANVNYQNELIKLKENALYSDFIEELSEIGVMQVSDLVDMTFDGREDYTILFDESVSNRNANSYDNKKCDVVLLSKDYIRVIKIVSMDYDFIDASESNEMFKIGYAALDKYLCRTSADVIGLVVIQPNLLAGSLCEVKIDGLLKAYNKEFLN